MEFFTRIWTFIQNVAFEFKVFYTSAIRIAQAGTAFSYFMWFLLFILVIVVFILFIQIVKMIASFFRGLEGLKDDDKDGIRNRRDKDRNGDGILDKFQSKKVVRGRK